METECGLKKSNVKGNCRLLVSQLYTELFEGGNYTLLVFGFLAPISAPRID
jgi:hypothetical protein